MQRLGGLGSGFLSFETPTMHMHVGGLMLVDPSTMSKPYSYADFRAYIDARMPLVPAFRRKLATVPLNIAGPAPAGDKETADVVAEILSRPMDRARPLWEMWIVEGRADGRIAVVSKVH